MTNWCASLSDSQEALLLLLPKTSIRFRLVSQGTFDKKEESFYFFLPFVCLSVCVCLSRRESHRRFLCTSSDSLASKMCLRKTLFLP